jgi:hypothetical protein
MYPKEPAKIAQGMYAGKRLINRDRNTGGIISAMMPYLSRIFMEWMT